jgi:hypothetical protein
MAVFNFYDLNSLLKSVRLQIELLESSVKAHPNDKELHKLLNEARRQETVILAKLRQWRLN